MRNKMKRVNTGINIVLLIIIVMLASGCQQTPERTAVVYGGGLEEKLKGSPAPFGAYNAPASWQETLDVKGSNTKIEINASIKVPDVTAFPVYKVKQTTFDDTRIGFLVNYFTKGKNVIEDTEPTKAELEEQLVLAKKNNDAEMVAELERRIAAAPETVEPEVITDWNAKKSPSGSFMDEDGEYARINVSIDRFGYNKNGCVLTPTMLALNEKDAFGEVAISEEDAIVSARDMLHELGVDYMIAANLEKAQRYSSVENAFTDKKPLSKGYMVSFARNIDGISGILNDHGIMFGITDDFAYRAPLYPEVIQVYVDEAGKVQSFVWWHPLEIEKKVTENAGLLPFEEIEQRIRDMLAFSLSNHDMPIKVTRIELNMAIVDVKDHPKEAMYIPAWFIYYTETFNDPETGEEEQQELRLGLNAIDGGRVLECPVDISPEMQKAIDEQKGNN